MNLTLNRRLFWFSAFIVLSANVALAHGGSYSGPGFPPPPGAPAPRAPGGALTPRPLPGGVPRGVTSGPDTRTWETWWALNKDDFFPARSRYAAGQTSNAGGYSSDQPKAPSTEELRELVLPSLIELVQKERDVHIRDSAAIAIGRLGDVREVKLLEGLVNDRERAVGEAAIVALGLLSCERAESALASIAKDLTKSARERGFAVIALGLSGGEFASNFLTKDLGADGDPLSGRGADIETHRVIAASLLHRSDIRPPDAALAPDAGTGFILKAIQIDAVKEQSFLATAYASLAKTRDPAAAKQIFVGLTHRKSEVRAGAAIALGRTLREPDEKSVKQIKVALDSDGDLFPRRMILISLGRMRGDAAKRVLLGELEHKDRQHRAFAVLGLALAGATEVIPALRAELKSANDASTVGVSAVALGLLRDKESVPAILELLEARKDPAVQAHLVEALLLLNEPGSLSHIEKLLTKTKDPSLLSITAITLGLIGAPGSEKTLIELIQGPAPITVKAAAAAGLGRRGDRAMIEPLLGLAKNPAEQDIARAFGVVALGILADKNRALSPFHRLAIDAHYELRLVILDELRDLL